MKDGLYYWVDDPKEVFLLRGDTYTYLNSRYDRSLVIYRRRDIEQYNVNVKRLDTKHYYES